jgi:hypothetical protein
MAVITYMDTRKRPAYVFYEDSKVNSGILLTFIFADFRGIDELGANTCGWFGTVTIGHTRFF